MVGGFIVAVAGLGVGRQFLWWAALQSDCYQCWHAVAQKKLQQLLTNELEFIAYGDLIATGTCNL